MKTTFIKLKYLIAKPIDIILSFLFLLSFLAISIFLIFLTNTDALAENTYSVSTRNISFKRNYEFIFFYNAACHHCMRFEPILKRYSYNTGIPVRAFVIGEGKSLYFPNSTVVTQEVIEQFFGSFDSSDSFEKGSSISVPTLFIINKNNLHAYPVSQGALTYPELYARMNELIPKIIRYERNENNESNKKNGRDNNE